MCLFYSLIKRFKTAVFSIIFIQIIIACHSPEESAKNHLKKGKELYEKGQFDEAILELKTSNQDLNEGETYYYMALVDEKQNNFKAMRQNLLRALELSPDLIDARIKLANLEVLFGNLDNAMEQAAKVLSVKPDNIDAKLTRAAVLIKQAKTGEAEQIIDALLTSFPDNLSVIALKVNLLFQKNEMDQAKVLITIGLLKEPKNIPIRLQRIQIFAAGKDTQGMIDDYQELIKFYPENESFKLSIIGLYAVSGKLQEAETLLREMVAKTPDNLQSRIIFLEFLNAKANDKLPGEFEQWLNSKLDSKLLLEISKWMLANGYEDLAKTGLIKVVEAEKNNKLALSAKTQLAEIEFKKKHYPEAEEAINQILKVNSDFVEANLLKARLLMSQNKLDEAIDLLNKAVWSKSNADDVYALLGQVYEIKKDHKQAEKNFKLSLETNPANMAAFLPIYYSSFQENQKETAKQLLEKALNKNPHQDLLLALKAELEMDEKKWDAAEATIRQLAIFSKNKSTASYLQAKLLHNKGQFSEAITIYEKVLEDYPDDWNVLVNLVRAYQGIKSSDKAVAYLESLHQKHPNEGKIARLLGELYLANHESNKARQVLVDQIHRTPHDIPLYLELAKIEADIQKKSEASTQVYFRGLDNNPDDLTLMLALAKNYERSGDRRQARSTYESLLKKNPQNDAAINNLAVLLIESPMTEDINKALSLAEKLKNSDNPLLQDTYAWVLVKTGKTQEALKILEQLALKEPKIAEFRYHLGVAHFDSGNKATAIIELKQALLISAKQGQNFIWQSDAKKLLNELEPTAKIY